MLTFTLSGSNYLNIQSNIQLKNALAQFKASNTMLSSKYYSWLSSYGRTLSPGTLIQKIACLVILDRRALQGKYRIKNDKSSKLKKRLRGYWQVWYKFSDIVHILSKFEVTKATHVKVWLHVVEIGTNHSLQPPFQHQGVILYCYKV